MTVHVASHDVAVDVSVVVPLLNEAATLRELVDRIAAVLSRRTEVFEIVLVDDGSNDETATLLGELEREHAWIRAFALSRNFGQAAATVCGLVESRGRIVVTMDGDLQNPPEEIDKLIDALGGDAAVATGCRATRHEQTWRWLGSRLVHWTARSLTGVRIEDFGGQFKAYRRDVIEATLPYWKPGSAFFPLSLWLGFPVAEVVVRHDPRKHGASRYTVGTLTRMLVDLAAGALGARRWRRPGKPRGRPGYVIARRPRVPAVCVEPVPLRADLGLPRASGARGRGSGADS